jgi:hypothetical protein
MKKMKFTQANVNAYKAPAGVLDHTVHDEGLPGFGLRVQAGGSKVYIIRYRLAGKPPCRVSFGNADKITLDAAKKEARRLFEQVANKIDPAKERAKAVVSTSANILALLPRFLSYMTSKGRAATYVSWNEFCLTFPSGHRPVVCKKQSRCARYETPSITTLRNPSERFDPATLPTRIRFEV